MPEPDGRLLALAPTRQPCELGAGQQEGPDTVVVPVKPGAANRYYAGAGWSQADMPTQEAWNAYLLGYLERLEHPVA